MEDICKRLESEMDSARWEWLKPHAERGVVIVVDMMLSMPQVGAAIASDDMEPVKGWLASGMIAKPATEQCQLWNRNSEKLFHFLIIEPFVLVQEISGSPVEQYFA